MRLEDQYSKLCVQNEKLEARVKDIEILGRHIIICWTARLYSYVLLPSSPDPILCFRPKATVVTVDCTSDQQTGK